MSIGHLVHVLLTVYNATVHVTQKSPGPMCGWVGRILRPNSYMSGSFWSKVPLWSIWFVAVPPWRPLHFRTVPVDDVVLFHSMVSDGGLVNYTTLPSSEAQVCVPAVKEATSLWCSFIDMYESGCRILPTQPYMGPGDFCVTYSVTL